MKRAARIMFCVALLSVLGMFAVSPRFAAQAPEDVVRITSPQMNAEVRGQVLINGRAAVPEFDYYKVEFGIGANPSDWALIGETHDTPVVDGLLATWDTAALPDGLYSLRLRVVKPDGNYAEHLVPQVKIVNRLPTETPTPTITPTLPPTVVVPVEGYTPVVERPTAPLAPPTPTPTLARPTRAAVSPLGDLKDYRNALILGAGAMGVVFILVGLILGIRRLL